MESENGMKKDKFCLVLATLIFGSMGLVVKKIPFASIPIAWCRGAIGCLTVLAFCLFSGQGLNVAAIRKNLRTLLISGCVLGGNWIMLFNAYKYTDVSIATVCNYMAPVIVIFLSPALFKEKLSLIRVACVFSAVAGLGLVAAAALYAGMIICNKRLRDISCLDSCAAQLGTAALFLTPFFLAGGGISLDQVGAADLLLLLCLGVIHAGAAFALYFTAVQGLSGQSVAALSYVEPAAAILLSFLILGERLTGVQLAGCVLALGSTFVSELWGGGKEEKAPEVSL